MKLRITTKLPRRLVVVALFVVALIGGGIATAAWLVSGTGSATTQAATAVNLTVSAGTPTATLYPGASGAVVASVANPNPFPVRVTSASFGAVTVTPLAGRTCTAASLTVSGPVTLGSPVNLSANSGATAVTIPNAVTMVSSADNGCQGATYSVQVTLSGASA
ncbi:hypothetical protein [Blastococcus xanthinilyticus]|uniref:Camelysin-like metallo-endopeptidase n=1 Tax=Blastococcus xanthinilyticus TaxID=1564164 RepID=A0A5S5CXS3_9ACTN|nr:hypothetical protein [Blastococcus xanthinilyticus]TYP87894.1 hypothetical protein BD833_10568 [Blastococcus xanthinilyticus]